MGLDCPAELEKQLEQRLCQVDPEKLMQQLEMPTNNQRLWTDYCGQQNAGNQYTEPSPPFLTPPLTPSAFSGYDSTSEHAAEETSSSASSISIARDPLSRGMVKERALIETVSEICKSARTYSLNICPLLGYRKKVG